MTTAGEALRELANLIDRGPAIPLPPSVFSALVRERADDLDSEGTSGARYEVVLIWSNQRGMWWRPRERGYTAHIDEAGRYRLEDAQRIVANATCSGQLAHERIDPVTGRRYREYDEAIVPAPITPAPEDDRG